MAAVALSAASSGCDAAARNSFERFIPSPEAARAGVSLAMEGWLKNLSPDFKDETSVTVSANPNIPYQVVISTIDAVRKANDSGEELFPDVNFGLAR